MLGVSGHGISPPHPCFPKTCRLPYVDVAGFSWREQHFAEHTAGLPRFRGVVASVRHRTRSGLNHSGVSSVAPDEEELPAAPCFPLESIVYNAVVTCRKEVLANESDLVVAARREGPRNRPSDSAVLEWIKARVPKPLIKRLVVFSFTARGAV